MLDEKNQTKEQDSIMIEGTDISIPSNLLDKNDDNNNASSEGKDAPKAPDTSGQPSGQPSDNFTERYKGKTNEELINIIRENQAYISKIKNTNTSDSNNSVDTIKAELGKVSSEIHNIKASLSVYDDEEDADDARYKQLKKDLEIKTRMQSELRDKETELKIQETINKTLYEQHGKQFLSEQRDKMAKTLGMENIDDTVWEAISGHAQNIAGVGNKMTEEDVVAGAVKALGFTVYNALVNANAQQEVRENIKEATSKTVLNVGNKQIGKSFSELSEQEHLKILDHLYKTDRKKFDEYSEKLKKL